jgi:hypothetical protein
MIITGKEVVVKLWVQLMQHNWGEVRLGQWLVNLSLTKICQLGSVKPVKFSLESF